MKKETKPYTKSVPNPYARKIIAATKLNPEEMQKLIAKSLKYHGGNLSMTIRCAIMDYKKK